MTDHGDARLPKGPQKSPVVGRREEGDARQTMLRALDGPWQWIEDDVDRRNKQARVLTASNALVAYVKLGTPEHALWIATRTLVNDFVSADG